MNRNMNTFNPSSEVGDPEGIRTPGRHRGDLPWEDEDPFSGPGDGAQGFDQGFASPTNDLSGTPAAAHADALTGEPAPVTLRLVDRSSLFTAYNVARGMVPDKGRLNRALGLALRKSEKVSYITTATRCTCPDWLYRVGPKGQMCKHQLSLALKAVAS